MIRRHLAGEGKTVNDQEAFYIKNGDNNVCGTAHSVKELRDMLINCGQDVYNFHTANGRNDFAEWIGKTIKNTPLAKKVKNAKNFDELKKTIHCSQC